MESINLLIAEGGKLETKDFSGRIALMQSARNGHTEAVNALVDAGAVRVRILGWDNDNFKNNNPYGFDENSIYILEPHNQGRILQWLSSSECLYDFGGYVSSSLRWSCIGFIDLAEYDANILTTSVSFEYIGVYSYTTASGSYNTLPKFKVRIENGHTEAANALVNAGVLSVRTIKYDNANFINNNPYGFDENSIYTYTPDEYQGRILQWLSRNECLYDFEECILSMWIILALDL